MPDKIHFVQKISIYIRSYVYIYAFKSSKNGCPISPMNLSPNLLDPPTWDLKAMAKAVAYCPF